MEIVSDIYENTELLSMDRMRELFSSKFFIMRSIRNCLKITDTTQFLTRTSRNQNFALLPRKSLLSI